MTNPTRLSVKGVEVNLHRKGTKNRLDHNKSCPNPVMKLELRYKAGGASLHCGYFVVDLMFRDCFVNRSFEMVCRSDVSNCVTSAGKGNHIGLRPPSLRAS